MRGRILVVEDDHDISRMIKLALVQAGYEVEIAYNGRDARDCVAHTPPDLILLDLMLPFIHGLDLLKMWKADPTTQHIPVVILTAKDDFSDMEKGWDAGSDLYLTKPLKLDELVVYVNTILER